ncbi:MAG: hypothetical protein EP321_09005 [Sphingomonadales bacterium]|nr:MAG: hypothetical protein EP321_09005 [Sphingomonadales bacterium]
MLKKVAQFFVPFAIIAAFVGLKNFFGTEDTSRPLAAGEMTTPMNTDVPGLEPLTGEALIKERRLHEEFTREATEEAKRVHERKAAAEEALANSSVRDWRGVNPLPVQVDRNRVTAKSTAIVCPKLFDLERALNLHNARRSDQALALGCRYLREGEQGVRLQQVGNMQEILFDTANGSQSYWGYVSHFVWEP